MSPSLVIASEAKQSSDAALIEQQIADRERRLSELELSARGAHAVH